MDMETIVSNDLSGGTKTTLENHLKADDFFGVEQFPESTITIKEVRGNVLIADLTVRDITNEVEIPFTVENVEEGSFDVMAAYEMDRSRWNVKYGSASFFSDIGDAAISDTITITIDLTMELEA